MNGEFVTAKEARRLTGVTTTTLRGWAKTDKVRYCLATNYSEIYLPKFESQKLTKNLNKTSNFNLLNLQHYRFKERLRFQCFEQGSKLVDCTEEYTSKTCTQCGELNDTLGCSEQFRCPKCNLSIDRDVNGARNIYLKNVP